MILTQAGVGYMPTTLVATTRLSPSIVVTTPATATRLPSATDPSH